MMHPTLITLEIAGVEQQRHCGGKRYARIELPPDGKVKSQLVFIYLCLIWPNSWWATKSTLEGTLHSALTPSAHQGLRRLSKCSGASRMSPMVSLSTFTSWSPCPVGKSTVWNKSEFKHISLSILLHSTIVCMSLVLFQIRYSGISQSSWIG